MTRRFRAAGTIVLLSVLGTNVAHTQESTQQPQTQPAPQAVQRPENERPLVPLRIQVILSKYQGERRVSALPYTLSVNANANAPGSAPSQLRMGADVPVPSGAFTGPDGKPSGPVNYRRVGTNIDCSAISTENDRFAVNLTIEDTSVYMGGQVSPETPRVGDLPVFRSFRSHNTLILRDGQTTQFTAATDRVTGEVTRVDVTLTVAK